MFINLVQYLFISSKIYNKKIIFGKSLRSKERTLASQKCYNFFFIRFNC